MAGLDPAIHSSTCVSVGHGWPARRPAMTYLGGYCAVRLAPPGAPPPPGPPAGRSAKFSASLLGPLLGLGLDQRIAPLRSAGLAGAWLKEMVKACASLGASLGTCHSATLPLSF